MKQNKSALTFHAMQFPSLTCHSWSTMVQTSATNKINVNIKVLKPVKE